MTTREPRVESGFSQVDRTSDPTAYVRRLDVTGANPFWQAMKRRIIALLDLHEGDRVLDVGCGTGDDVRALARLVGPTGLAVGVDSSAIMVAEARRRTARGGLPVEVHLADAHDLDFPDESFHACRVERVLQHLDDPRQALSEMARVARPGGRIVVVEPDHGAEFIQSSDRAMTRRILNCRRDHFRNATIGRELTKLFVAVGLTDIAVTFFSWEMTDLTPHGESPLLRKYVDDARAASKITESEGQRWLADLEEAAKGGRYRRVITIFLVSGRKPRAE